MAARRQEPDSWFGRLANELYLGAVVLAGLALAGGVVAVLVEVALEVSDWVAMAD
jgi:outer membrane murein-binding lipoprotein Lpp